MKTTRLLALSAASAAALLAMTGCIQLPAPSAPTTPATSEGGSGGGGTESGSPEAGADLAGTTWTGSFNGQLDVTFELNEDGSIDFTSWGPDQSFDSPADVWSGDASSLTMTITQIRVDETSTDTFDVTLDGTAESGSIDASGSGTDGGSYSLTATQG